MTPPKMSAEERAEVIMPLLGYEPKLFKGRPGFFWEDATKIVIAQIQEAEQQARQEGFAEARERAEKIVNNSFVDWELYLVDHVGENLITERAFIADRISQMQPSKEGKHD